MAAGNRTSLAAELRTALTELKRAGSQANREGMARYAIPSDNAFGVTMPRIQALGRKLGRNHDLAKALWDTGVYEARVLAAWVADPARLTPAQMDRWQQDFDSWAICDTVCFHLFDRSAHAWSKAAEWSGDAGEFQKRAGFALLWSLSVHDKRAADEAFRQGLEWIERESGDARNFVRKAVNMALRAIGKRNRNLNVATEAVARKLAGSPNPTSRWIGKHALRELTSVAVRKRVAER